MKALGIITARAGSKRLPGKNTALLAGRPLVSYTLDAARRSRLLDRVVVSTDDEAVAALARQAGVEVPFVRPAELATDEATSLAVARHALRWLAEHDGYRPDVVVLLEPTSPLRTADDIDAVLRLHAETGADNVVTVVRDDEHHPVRAKTMDEAGRLRDAGPTEAEVRRRQDLPPVYFRNGAVYSLRREVVESGRLYGDDVRGLVMPPERSVDVNTAHDLRVAECLLRGGA